MTNIRKLLATCTPNQKVRFAILCAKQVCNEPGWNIWADAWLSGDNRSQSSAIKAGAWDEESNHLPALLAADAANYAVIMSKGQTRWSERSLEWTTAETAEYVEMQIPTINLAALAAQAIEEEPA